MPGLPTALLDRIARAQTSGGTQATTLWALGNDGDGHCAAPSVRVHVLRNAVSGEVGGRHAAKIGPERDDSDACLQQASRSRGPLGRRSTLTSAEERDVIPIGVEHRRWICNPRRARGAQGPPGGLSWVPLWRRCRASASWLAFGQPVPQGPLARGLAGRSLPVGPAADPDAAH
jgi:hypothetical protein